MTNDATDKALNKTLAEGASGKGPKETVDKAGNKHFTTFGMTLHKWGTYITIDWFWNYLSGMAFACWGKYTKSGQALWTKPVTLMATKMAEIGKVSAHGTPKSVGNIVAFFSVIAGGTLFTIPPLMLLESKERRKGIVKWLDEKRYGKEAVANDPRFAQAYDEIEHEQKQGFWTGQLSRVVSLAPLLATVMLDKPRDFTQPYFDKVSAGSAKIYKAVGLGKDKLFKNYSDKVTWGVWAKYRKAKKEYIQVHETKPNFTKEQFTPRGQEWEWLHANSAVDFGLEPWYAVLHMATYRTFAKWFGKASPEKKDGTQAQQAPAAGRSVVIDDNGNPVRPEQNTSRQKQEDRPAMQVQQISRDEHRAHMTQVDQLNAI